MILFCLMIISAEHSVFASARKSAPRFLNLSGKLDKTPDEIDAQINKIFIDPLESSHGSILSSYITQSEGEGEFYLHLIVEPATDKDNGAFEQYIKKSEASGFMGIQVRFQKVSRIFQISAFQAGVYDGTLDEPFRVAFEMRRSVAFSSLREWVDYTNNYGFAMRDKDHSKFLAFLEKFTNDADDFDNLKKNILTVSDMVAIDPRPYLILDDNETIGPEFDKSPFLPYRFPRRCFAPDYENGMCEH
jgi:hypothetical protein